MKQSLRRDVIEELIRQDGAFVSLSHITCAVNANRVAVRRVLEHLMRMEAVTVVKRYERPPDERGRPTQEIIYRPKLQLKPMVSKVNTENSSGWDRMWRVIRAKRSFTRQDLVELAGVRIENVRQFTKLLRRHGYVCERSRAQWELIRDPGPHRPVGGRG
jgi:hypothetical protein